MSPSENFYRSFDDTHAVQTRSGCLKGIRRIDPLRVVVWSGLSCFVVLTWTAVIVSFV